MRILAVELSSRVGSIALIEGSHVVAERAWDEDFRNRQQLFDALEAMALDWSSIDLFVVGRGPGAFSGLRIGFSVVNSLAAPGGKPVYALNSGASLAARFGAEKTVVVGDARRNQVWAGLFDGCELRGEYGLMDIDRFKAFVPEGALVASPDHDRLEALLSPFPEVAGGGSVYPSAGEIGTLVARRVETGIESEPLVPLYMHPPVFIAPRFPG